MLDGTVVPNWIYSILAEISASKDCELSLAILNEAEKAKGTFWQKLRNWREYPFAAYARIDSKFFSHRVPLDAFAPTDAAQLLKNTDCMWVTPLRKKFVDRFSGDDLNAVRSFNLDVMLRFGFRIIKGDILKVAKFGVWSFHHGDNDFYRGGPALFWEIYENNPVSGTMLQILNEDLDGGRVIYKSFASTHGYSLYMNRNAAFWKTAAFITRKLRALAEGGIEALESIPAAPDAKPRIYRTPKMGRVALFSLRCATRLVAAQLDYRFLQEQWFIAIAKRLSDSGTSSVPGHAPFKIVPMPPGRYYADPCAISVGGQDFLFFEDCALGVKKARISCTKIDPSGQVGDITVVLEEPFHLSYPFVFELDGDYFMIPETSAANSIRLYRATAFPTRWQFETTLITSAKPVDATLHYENGVFWIFANIPEPGASRQDELHLFYSNALHGPWKAHPQNPIVSDVRHARPAGRLFVHNGRLLRPAQNSSIRYGGSIVLNAVCELNPKSYKETRFEDIGPEWLGNAVATHTLSITAGIVATDGLKHRLKF